MKKKWTSSELEVLIASNGKILPIIDGRSPESIRQKMMKLKLKAAPKNLQWTQEEIEILKKASLEKKIPSVKGRTKGAIRNKMTELGLRETVPVKSWSKEELYILKNFSGVGVPCVEGRTSTAVRCKMKELGFFSPKNKIWSKLEIKQLRSLCAEGKKVVIPGRTEKAISKKIHDLKIKIKKAKPEWTNEEIESLKTIGHVLGRSKNSIQQMKVRLGITKKYEPRNKWGSANENKLKKLYASGLSATKIFQMSTFPGQTRTSIQNKLSRMKLVKAKRFPMEVECKFNKFVQDNWMGRTPEEITDLWNGQNYKHSISKQKVIKTLGVLGIKISCHEVSRINNLKKKEAEIFSTNTQNSNAMMEKIRAERIRVMKARYESSKDIWTGLQSKEKIDFAVV